MTKKISKNNTEKHSHTKKEEKDKVNHSKSFTGEVILKYLKSKKRYDKDRNANLAESNMEEIAKECHVSKSRVVLFNKEDASENNIKVIRAKHNKPTIYVFESKEFNK